MSRRFRFAPSPTGYLHVGGARTALFNWLLARQSGGELVLRIEDTDAERNREEWVAGIVESLAWLGLDFDEGPLRQSTRSRRYAEAVEVLRAGGHLYYCDCTREEMEQRARLAGRPPGYDGHCRERSLGPGPGRALRFAVPRAGVTVVEDEIRGPVSFANAELEDFVVVRSSGAALFVLTNTVDDLDQGITDVVRGEEHLPNTPKHELLWRALGASTLPRYAHLPVLVNERRQKLSKRRDTVAVEEFRSQGYLPEAMCNYLALLGWGPEGDQDVLSRDDLVQQFSLARVSHSPAFFDLAKLTHFNGVWLRSLSPQCFIDRSRPFLADRGLGDVDPEALAHLAPLVQDRVSTLAEAASALQFLRDPGDPVAEQWKAVASEPSSDAILESAATRLGSCEWTVQAIEGEMRSLAEEVGRPLRRAQAPVRVAVTGSTVGLPLFDSLFVLGREEALRRVSRAARRLAQATDSAPGAAGAPR